MRKILVLSAFIVVSSSIQISVLKADESDLENAKTLQQELEHSLVAPCCWNMTVDQHESPAARQVRTKISELIEQGKTKEEILSYFVAQPQYGERILAAPSQKSFLGKMAYWLIPIALIFGAFIAVKTIKSLSKTTSSKPAQHKKTSSQQKSQDKWNQMVEDELNKLDL